MKRVDRTADLSQPVMQMAHRTLTVTENHHALELKFVDYLEDILDTAVTRRNQSELLYFRPVVTLGGYRNLYGVMLILPRDIHDVP
ncbi:hypothetical protein SDC9_189455 [bioreactor metagenome]|uniref:Uncharacterized protein n=1 Tax=bioreactor metagenome TaxID=1076179 RepID=A0A645HSS2_9ZZZZ